MLILAALGSALIAAALIIGIDDNLPGILLCFAGIGSLIYAFIRHWKKRSNYVIMLVASIIGMLVFAILHNVFEAVGLEVIGAGFFLLAVLICPIAFLIGLVGTLATANQK